MANLRTNNLSGEQGQNAYRGAVFFNATPNAGLQMLSSDFAFGVDDFTVEGWFWYSGDGATIASIFDSRTTDNNTIGFFVGVNASGKFYTYGFPTGTAESAHNTIPPNSGWHHFAIVRSGNDGFRFLNGQQVGSTEDMSSTNYTQSGGVVGQPSNTFTSSLYRWKGYLSNIRVHKGEAIYTSNFTPPTTELKATSSNCVLLCCQDSDDPTQDATGKTITAQNLISDQPKVIPPFGVDAGNTFGGPIQQSSQGYMYFPTGRSEERGRGRGVYGGGGISSPVNPAIISFIDVQSQGNTTTFGSLTSENRSWTHGFGSSTRAIWSGGGDTGGSTLTNSIDLITIATTSNATDFGDAQVATTWRGSFSNDTRGISGGGYISPANINTIDFVTIANTGNAQDFGDLTQVRRGIGAMASSTRGIFAGGFTPSATNIMEFVTIATTSNAQDFGDMTQASRHDSGGCSNGVRGIIGGGQTPTALNTIQFITIASAGDASDFGDLQQTQVACGTLDNTIRGVFSGSYANPASINTMNFITISTQGNSTDFGDNTHANYAMGGTSDSHGGLS